MTRILSHSVKTKALNRELKDGRLMEINTGVIKELINSLNEAGFDNLKLETSDFKLTVERGNRNMAVCDSSNTVVTNVASVAKQITTQNVETVEEKGTVVKSPIVGTFYTSPSPDKDAFVSVGQKVKRGDTLYIVESMKLMNEIASECDGTVAEIYVNNGDTVEYGQKIMRIE